MTLTAGEIAAMRAVAEETFDSTAVINRGTITPNQGGGGTLSRVARGTVSCHLAPIVQRGEREGVYADRIAAEANWICTMPAETTIDKADQVVIGSTTYEVAALRAPRTWELTRRVELSEVS